jgi:uncharacterized protein DUF5908
MPVEIGKLVFRARVDVDSASDPAPPKEQTDERRALVELCVEEVLEILRREKER